MMMMMISKEGKRLSGKMTIMMLEIVEGPPERAYNKLMTMMTMMVEPRLKTTTTTTTTTSRRPPSPQM